MTETSSEAHQATLIQLANWWSCGDGLRLRRIRAVTVSLTAWLKRVC
jgi:hypothetical protein